MNHLEQLPDSLVSLGADPTTLDAFKRHAQLPTASTWTESDLLLQGYLLAAERIVDDLSGMTLRARSFTLTFECFDERRHRCYRGRSFRSLRYPKRPIVGHPTIAWTAADATTGTWTSGTDFATYGANAIRPELMFPLDFQFPDVFGLPFPYVLSFTTGPAEPSYAAAAMICIYELAAAYQRNPEMSGKELISYSPIFDANLTLLQGSFL